MTETTTEPTPDLAALEELYAWAEGQTELKRQGLPSEWDQGVWGRKADTDCGTACCIAGRQVLLDGGAFVVNGLPFVITAMMPGGREVDVQGYATERLGLNEEQADALFNSGNNLADLRKIIDLIADGETFPYGYYPEDY